MAQTVVGLLLLLSSFYYCQNIEDGWKGIRPLSSQKEAVDKILGPSEIDDSGYYRYRFEDTFIRVNYSGSPCIAGSMSRGKYNVPENTVLDYSVVFNKPFPLTGLEFARKKYHKDTSGDVRNTWLYVDNDDGIIVSAFIQQGTEYVSKIYFEPRKGDVKKHMCKGAVTREVGVTSDVIKTVSRYWSRVEFFDESDSIFDRRNRHDSLNFHFPLSIFVGTSLRDLPSTPDLWHYFTALSDRASHVPAFLNREIRSQNNQTLSGEFPLCPYTKPDMRAIFSAFRK